MAAPDFVLGRSRTQYAALLPVPRMGTSASGLPCAAQMSDTSSGRSGRMRA